MYCDILNKFELDFQKIGVFFTVAFFAVFL